MVKIISKEDKIKLEVQIKYIIKIILQKQMFLYLNFVELAQNMFQDGKIGLHFLILKEKKTKMTSK